MTERFLGAERVGTAHLQFAIYEDPEYCPTAQENWSEGSFEQGFSGNSSYRTIGTRAESWENWIEVVLSDTPPVPEDWHRIVLVDFETKSGQVYIGSIFTDEGAALSLKIEPGIYSIYVAGRNIGVDQFSLGETSDEDELSDVTWNGIASISSPARRSASG